jgi:hypothetical protein
VDYDYIRKMHSESIRGKNNPQYGKSTTKNKICITNGIKNVFINRDDVIPEGWYLGSSGKGIRVYTNGIVNIRLRNGGAIPPGFYEGSKRKGIPSKLKGMVFGPRPLKTKLKIKQSKQGIHWYTNGINDLCIKSGEEIPEGFRSGRTNTKLKQITILKYIEEALKHFGFNNEKEFIDFIKNEIDIGTSFSSLNKKLNKNKTANHNLPSLRTLMLRYNLVCQKCKPGPKKRS